MQLAARPYSSSMAALALVLVACSGGPAPDDSGLDGGSDASALCSANAECDDGLYCNGSERCAPNEPGADPRGCAPASSAPCAPSLCDESRERCLCDDGGDTDGDGEPSIACGGTDCDDDDPRRSPGHLEQCDPDGIDEDCDPTTVGTRDRDGDGAIDWACCNGDHCGRDCDDMRPDVHPLAPELCDGRDNDCDGRVDEEVLLESWVDDDDDGWGEGEPTLGCTVPTDRVDRGGDCDGANPTIHPTAVELCDGLDNDCDGLVDEGAATTCESMLASAIAECIAGECVVVGCTGMRFDCNGIASDGCEADPCHDVSSCDGCGRSCGAGDLVMCLSGLCAPSDSTSLLLGVARDVVTGAPIAGASIHTIDRCGPTTVSTEPDGSYVVDGRGRWARIEAPGYPAHVQPLGVSDLLPRARLDAWLASSGLSLSPDRAIVVVDHGSPGDRPVVTTARVGERRWADGDTLLPPGSGTSTREVLLDVVPGRARVGGSQSDGSGCTTYCGDAQELLLEPGTVTFVGGFDCATTCH